MSFLDLSSASKIESPSFALFSMAVRTLSSALRDATTLLYADAQRFRSWGVSSYSLARIWSAKVIISSNL